MASAEAVEVELARVKAEIESLKTEIKSVDAGIKEVERKIEKVEIASNDEQQKIRDKEYLQVEKQKLREEKNILQGDKNILHERVNKLLDRLLSAARRPLYDTEDPAEIWARLKPALPLKWPSSARCLQAILFPPNGSQKIPIIAEQVVRLGVGKAGIERDRFTLTSGNSDLALTLSHFLVEMLRRQKAIRSETNTTVLVGSIVEELLDALAEESSGEEVLFYDMTWNMTEIQSTSSSHAVKPKSKPDTILVARECTLLIGEDKKDCMSKALDDLTKKRADISLAFYGPVNFLLGYGAAGREYQWYWLDGASLRVDPVGPCLNLCNREHMCDFIISWVNAYYMLLEMCKRLPDLGGRLPLFKEITKGAGKSYKSGFSFHGDGIEKRITSFNNFAREHHTSFPLIQRAYAASASAKYEGYPFLVQAAEGPTLRNDKYFVRTKPGGYRARCLKEEDLKALAIASCKAAAVLHKDNLVHRDIRLDNFVNLGPKVYMLIDLETVGESPGQPLPQEFGYRGWDRGTLDEERRYTWSSDMYQIGRLLQGESQGMSCSRTCQDFIGLLLLKRLTAEDALSHPWFTHMELEPSC